MRSGTPGLSALLAGWRQISPSIAADAAREAMADALALGAYLAAGFLVVGVIATLFIPRRPSTPQPSDGSTPEGAPLLSVGSDDTR